MDAVVPRLRALAASLPPPPPPAVVYEVASRYVALPGWALLVVAAAAGATPRPRAVAAHLALPLVFGLSALYVSCLVGAVQIDRLPPTDLGSLAELRSAFTSDWMLTAGWVHYLAMDLLLGLGVLVDAGRRRGGAGLLWRVGLIVCLAGVCLLAPAGVLMYAVFRTVVRQDAAAAATAPPPREGRKEE